MLTGNIVSLGMGGIICVVASLISPEDYDFVSMKQIRMLDEDLDGDKGFAAVRNPRLQVLGCTNLYARNHVAKDGHEAEDQCAQWGPVMYTAEILSSEDYNHPGSRFV